MSLLSQRKKASDPSATKPRRGVIYARVSSKEQEEGYSIDAQLGLLREYCARNCIEIVEELIEAETAKTAGRREFGRMVKIVQDRRLEAIVVEKTDRIYRNLKDRVTVDELGVELHLVKEGEVISRESRSHSRFIHDIKLVVAKNYVDNLSEETKKGMLEKARQGIWPTKAPLGYLNVERNGRRIIEVDPERAPIVRELFRVYGDGRASLKNLVRIANDLGLTTKGNRRIAKSHLAVLLQNPAYCGLIDWGGELHPGRHEALVDRSTFERVQDVMHGRRQNNAGFGVKSFAYRGVFTCAHCGCALTAEMKKERYVYYHCTGNRGNCPKPFVREEKLTSFFSNLLRQISIPADVIAWISGELLRERQDSDALLKLREERLKKDETRLMRRLETLYVDKSDGELSLETYRSLKSKADAELAEIRLAQATLTHPSKAESLNPEALLELAATASNRFENADSEGKRELLSYVCSNSTFGKDGVQVDLLKPFDIVLAVHQETALNAEEDQKVEKWLPD